MTIMIITIIVIIAMLILTVIVVIIVASFGIQSKQLDAALRAFIDGVILV